MADYIFPTNGVKTANNNAAKPVTARTPVVPAWTGGDSVARRLLIQQWRDAVDQGIARNHGASLNPTDLT